MRVLLMAVPVDNPLASTVQAIPQTPRQPPNYLISSKDQMWVKHIEPNPFHAVIQFSTPSREQKILALKPAFNRLLQPATVNSISPTGAEKLSDNLEAKPVIQLLTEQQGQSPQLVPEQSQAQVDQSRHHFSNSGPPVSKSKTGKLKGTAWLLMRNTVIGPSPQSLAAQGQLGGSQWGIQALYPLTQHKTQSKNTLNAEGFARLTSPLPMRRGKEMAAGFRLSRRAPLYLAVQAERRVALDKGGRDAFAVTFIAAHDGYRLPQPLKIRGYVQTGLVGLSSRDAFIDGHAVIEAPIKSEAIKAGIGLWGAHQPGVSRLDIGPELRLRPQKIPQTMISLQWRHRIAGQAQPDTGLAVVIGADF